MDDFTAVDGETPFEAADAGLVPGKTVLVQIDLQNDFLHPDGHYAQNGIDIAHMRRVIEPIVRLTEEARRRGVPVVWTQHGTKGVEDGGPFMKLRPFLRDGGLRQKTWGYEILDALSPHPDDWYVEKTRLSGFFATNLDVILRGLKAETVIFTGVLTNQCVAATSKDASFRDYMPIVVEDCAGTTLPNLHDPAIEMMRVGWSAVSQLDTVMGQLAEFPLNNAGPR